MDVLISIKPEYVNQIRLGNKKFEFRKAIFRDQLINNIFIYETVPTKKIVGYFDYVGYIKGTPTVLWNQTEQYAGIDKNTFFDYFAQKDIGYAIIIDKIQFFEIMINPFELFDKFNPPQSYIYFDGSKLN